MESVLAILLITMRWTRKSRTQKAAVIRQGYYQPVMIEEDIPLSGEGIFLKKCDYIQEDGYVHYRQAITGGERQEEWRKNRNRPGRTIAAVERQEEWRKNRNRPGRTIAAVERQEEWRKNRNRPGRTITAEKRQEKQKRIGNQPFTAHDECAERNALRYEQSIQRDRGSFYAVTDVPVIPYIRIAAEVDSAWRIWWYDSGQGLPRRRGGNEDLYHPGARLAGRPNVLNETAFILKKGESGRLRYNYRLPPFDDQCQSYICHDVYMVHTDQLVRDIFMRTYDYEYEQLADLSRLHACLVR